MLISEKINSDIYSYVLEHLDEILLISETTEDLKNNIKLVSYNYLLETNNIYFIESFSDIADIFKTIFWSTTLAVWTGKISLANWFGGIITDLVSEKRFNIAGSLFSNIISKITGRTLSGLSDESLMLINAQLLKATSILLFPTVLVGLAIYRLVTYSDIQLIKNFEFSLRSVLETLQLSNKSELFSIFKMINTKYNDILANNCAKNSDKESSLKCASNYYVKYITEDVLSLVIKEYIMYSKKNNIDLSHIITFHDLMNYDIGINTILSKRLSLLYEFYVKILNRYIFDSTLKKRYIDLLDKYTVKYIKEVYDE